jgi:transposase-like protein
MTLIELLERFPTDETCRQHLIRVRWPAGVQCPKCNCGRVSELPKRRQWTCLGCRYRFSATSGTIFHQSHIGLKKWFMAIFILLNAKKSKSSLELNRELGISQECCWHMCHRIREAMREDGTGLFSGIVQMDEHFTGGLPRRGVRKPKSETGRGTTRPIVVGAVESSSGKVRTAHVPDVRKTTMIEFAEQHIDMPNTDLHTDQLKSYNQLGKMCRSHGVVDHSDWFVSESGVHCNGAENAWSLFSRAVIGSFHRISKKHLHRYLSEFDSRFNSRKEKNDHFFQRILSQSNGRRLAHSDLIGKA